MDRFSLKSFISGFFSAIVAFSLVGYSLGKKENPYQPLETFAQALSYIENEYAEPIERKELIYRAIEGMVRQLDPFSSFIRPERYQKFKHWTKGELGSPGFDIKKSAKGTIVSRVYRGSPAAKAGVSEGDILLELDGKNTQKVDIKKIRELLLGPLGSRIKIKLKKKSGPIVSLQLTRKLIWEENIELKNLKSGILYIKITFFQDYTAQKLLKIFSERKKRKILTKGVILDLRDNPGGLYKQGVKVADLFLAQGSIVTVKGRKPEFTEREEAHPKGTLKDIPLVVLINSDTASAAEIVAAALKDHRRAVLIGQQTYGKGSIQSLMELNDGSALKLTIAHYYSPSGRKIDGNGVTPHIGLPTESAALDIALKIIENPKIYRGTLEKIQRKK